MTTPTLMLRIPQEKVMATRVERSTPSSLPSNHASA